MFIRNAWYVACESKALDNHTPLGRTICDQPMVFFEMPTARRLR